MPMYEMVVLMRNMKRPEIAACMKRTAEVLLNNGAVLRAIENLGMQKDIAYKMKAHGKKHLVGAFALYRFNGRTSLPAYAAEELSRDVDVVRATYTALKPPENYECTLEEELQVPMDRPSVKKLMETGKRKVKEDPIKAKIHGPF